MRSATFAVGQLEAMEGGEWRRGQVGRWAGGQTIWQGESVNLRPCHITVGSRGQWRLVVPGLELRIQEWLILELPESTTTNQRQVNGRAS